MSKLDPEYYYAESPQDRRRRRHEDDKRENPERHNPTAEIIPRTGTEYFCAWCAPDWQDNYEYDAANDRYVLKSQ